MDGGAPTLTTIPGELTVDVTASGAVVAEARTPSLEIESPPPSTERVTKMETLVSDRHRHLQVPRAVSGSDDQSKLEAEVVYIIYMENYGEIVLQGAKEVVAFKPLGPAMFQSGRGRGEEETSLSESSPQSERIEENRDPDRQLPVLILRPPSIDVVSI